MKKIFYIAGSHGNFLKWLFDCYISGRVSTLDFNVNGNSHNHNSEHGIINIDVCAQGTRELYNTNEEKYAIVWHGLDEFFYIISCYTDRGGVLTQNGIALCETDLLEYEKIYGAPVRISKEIKKNTGYDTVSKGTPPRAILRDYYMLGFYTYFRHDVWLKNEELKNSDATMIRLDEILSYDKLLSKMEKLFGKRLDFANIYQRFFDLNIPITQLAKVKRIYEAIEKQENVKIEGLNVISEAYLLFLVEKKFFDIPMRIGNNFFKTTKELLDYVLYVPTYLRQPNKLFSEYYQIYKRL